jgi:hypothetical protein
MEISNKFKAIELCIPRAGSKYQLIIGKHGIYNDPDAYCLNGCSSRYFLADMRKNLHMEFTLPVTSYHIYKIYRHGMDALVIMDWLNSLNPIDNFLNSPQVYYIYNLTNDRYSELVKISSKHENVNYLS